MLNNVSSQIPTDLDLNFGWRFTKGDVAGAHQSGFDDSGWRTVNIPHDWSIEDLNKTSGPLIELAVGRWNVGYIEGGTAWYRKSFDLSSDYKDKIIHLQFDGVYMNADLWINDYHVGSRAYGYSTFWFDITPYIEVGGKNVIAVEVKNIGRNSRWYSGSGIYRPVTLKIMNRIHMDHWGPAVATPLVSDSKTNVKISTRVINTLDLAVRAKLISTIKEGKNQIVATSQKDIEIGRLNEESVTDNLTLKNPNLWSVDSPNLYTVLQQLKIDGNIIDQRQATFGIRTISFTAEKGLLLNGKSTLLKGSCMHHDNYMLGSAAYPRAEERRVELTKAAGFNAIRCAHNPPSQSFLDACDRIGVLVIDEAFDQWTKNKWDHGEDYGRHFQEWWQKDIESMVLRDRNHPCIIMWSLGNEIPEQGSEYGVLRLKQLRTLVNKLDPSRPVTMGVNNSGPKMDAFFGEMDIVGYNYRLATYISDQKRVPDRVAYGSESFSRDAYQYWKAVEELPYIIGDFVWTGWDYLGEASIGWNGYGPNWERLGEFPWHAAYCGEIDLTGYKRPAAYYRDVLWKTNQNKVSAFVLSPEPSLHPPPDSTWQLNWTYRDIHPSWTWPGYEGRELEVDVYSACEEVELFLNGKSIGRKSVSAETEFKALLKVKYEPGELKAIGYEAGKKEAEWILRTAGAPQMIKLSADREVIKADGYDLSYITVELLDEHGNRVYDWIEDKVIDFVIEGEGDIIGVGNANPTSVESFQKPQRKTFRGRCLILIKSTLKAGTITLKATAQGLKQSTIEINSKT
jgi:beta-galactosidase